MPSSSVVRRQPISPERQRDVHCHRGHEGLRYGDGQVALLEGRQTRGYHRTQRGDDGTEERHRRPRRSRLSRVRVQGGRVELQADGGGDRQLAAQASPDRRHLPQRRRLP